MTYYSLMTGEPQCSRRRSPSHGPPPFHPALFTEAKALEKAGGTANEDGAARWCAAWWLPVLTGSSWWAQTRGMGASGPGRPKGRRLVLTRGQTDVGAAEQYSKAAPADSLAASF